MKGISVKAGDCEMDDAYTPRFIYCDTALVHYGVGDSSHDLIPPLMGVVIIRVRDRSLRCY